jgi:glutathione S-transferase
VEKTALKRRARFFPPIIALVGKGLHMTTAFTLYGWQLSYFTGKVRCYLNYKGIPYVDQQVDLFTLMRTIKRHTGVVVMPVLRTPDAEWLQDSSVIIDHLEALYPATPVLPTTPIQRFTAYLLEAWGDEWWIPVAMHTRWSHAENYALWEREAGPNLLPHFPPFIQRWAAAYPAKAMRSKLHSVGVRPEQLAVLDAWTQNMLDLLEQHFAAQDYLLGGHPTLADYGLVGTLYGHLGRDPWPARELIAPRPHLRAWIEHMANPPAQSKQQPLLANDAIAVTLEPILRVVFAEFVPMLASIQQRVMELLPHYPTGKTLPRGLPDIDIGTAQGNLRRAALPYTLWMAQRVLDSYQAMSAADQLALANWLKPLGGLPLLSLKLPRLQRSGLRVVVA